MSEVEIVLKTEVPTNGKGSGMNPKIVLVDHPLVRSKLSMLRDKRTSSKDYRDLIYQIGLFVGLRATANLKLNGEENVWFFYLLFVLLTNFIDQRCYTAIPPSYFK